MEMKFVALVATTMAMTETEARWLKDTSYSFQLDCGSDNDCLRLYVSDEITAILKALYTYGKY
jgi:hypothetical protein